MLANGPVIPAGWLGMPEETVLHFTALAPQALVVITHTDDDPL
jgi:hypothetical protein